MLRLVSSAPVTLERIQELQRTANHSEALALLNTVQGCALEEQHESAIFIKAQLLSRKNPNQCIDYLQSVYHRLNIPSSPARWHIACARAYAALQQFDVAREELEKAHHSLFLNPSITLSSAVGYQRTRIRWMLREYDPHCADMKRALSDPHPQSQIVALAMRGWMYAGLQQYESMVESLTEAVLIAGRFREHCDVLNVAEITEALLHVAIDLGDEVAVQVAEHCYEGIAFTPDIAYIDFRCTNALALHKTLSGNVQAGQSMMWQAVHNAQSAVNKFVGLVHRGYIAKILNHPLWCNDQLIAANHLNRDIDWEHTSGEERYSLLLFVALCADYDPELSKQYLALAQRIGVVNVVPNLGLRNDGRAEAQLRFATATVEYAFGNKDTAQSLALEAHKFYEGAHLHYKAALTASLLHQITGADAWRVRGQQHIVVYPHSWLHQRLHGCQSPLQRDEVYLTLTPAQKQVFTAIVFDCLRPKGIAAKLNRSENTVNQHIKAIYQAFGVCSREELLKTAQQRGIDRKIDLTNLG